MAKMTLEDLRKLREEKRKILKRRDVSGNDVVVIVGMGTCGIAAGSKKILEILLDEIEEKNLDDHVGIKQSCCMGLCHAEPTVEVKVQGIDRKSVV